MARGQRGRRTPRGAQHPAAREAHPAQGSARQPRAWVRHRDARPTPADRPPPGCPRLPQPPGRGHPAAATAPRSPPLPTWHREASICLAPHRELPAGSQRRIAAAGQARLAGPTPPWLRLAGRGQRGAAGPPRSAPLRPGARRARPLRLRRGWPACVCLSIEEQGS